MLINWMAGILPRCISNHHYAHLKYPTISFVSFTSRKLKNMKYRKSKQIFLNVKARYCGGK